MMSRDDGLRLLALLVVLALATQGVSTAVKRLWLPAHYHLPTASTATAAPDHSHDHAPAHGDPTEPVVSHPWRGHNWFQDQNQDIAPVHTHARETVAAHAASHRADTHAYTDPAGIGHAGIGHHRHARGVAGVVYVPDADESAPVGTTPRVEADNFWGDLPPAPTLAWNSRRGDPPPPPAPMRLARADEAPLRPPC